jgi:hypothetical protein
MSGLQVLEQLRWRAPDAQCVVLTGFWDYHVEFEAIRLGARACLTKPLIGDDILEMIHLALDLTPLAGSAVAGDVHDLSIGPVHPHGLARIGEKVVAFAKSPRDAATLREFGREVGISVGGFRNWCHTAGLKANSVLRFARALRATIRQESASVPSSLLDIVDSRTLRTFLKQSGGSDDRLPAGLDEFFRGQRFIDSQQFVATVRAAVEASLVRTADCAVTGDEADPGSRCYSAARPHPATRFGGAEESFAKQIAVTGRRMP